MSAEDNSFVKNEDNIFTKDGNVFTKDELLEDLFHYLTSKGVKVQQQVSYTLIDSKQDVVGNDSVVTATGEKAAGNYTIDSRLRDIPVKEHTPLYSKNEFPLGDTRTSYRGVFSHVEYPDDSALFNEFHEQLSDDEFFTQHLAAEDKIFTTPKKTRRSKFRYKYQRNRDDIYGYPFRVKNVKKRYVTMILLIVLLLLASIMAGIILIHNKPQHKSSASFTGIDIAQQYLTTPSHKLSGSVVISTPGSKLNMTVSGFYSNDGLKLIQSHDDQHWSTVVGFPKHDFIHTNLKWNDLGYSNALDSAMWGEITPKTSRAPLVDFYVTNLPETVNNCLQEKIQHHDPSFTFDCGGTALVLKKTGEGIDLASKNTATSQYQLHITPLTKEEYSTFRANFNETVHSIGTFQLLYPALYYLANPQTQDVLCSWAQCTTTQTISIRSMDGDNYKDIDSMKIRGALYNKKGINLGSCNVPLIAKLNFKQTFTCAITGLNGQPESPRIKYNALITVNSKNYIDKWLEQVQK